MSCLFSARASFSNTTSSHRGSHRGSHHRSHHGLRSRFLFRNSLLSLLLLGGAFMTSCGTVPLPGKGVAVQQSVRPVKPLLDGREGDVTIVTPKASPSTSPGQKKTAAPGANKTAAKPSDAAIAKQLETAANKASSALSLSQSAQTEDDWALVAEQWRRAIALLPTKTERSSLADDVAQARTTYNQSLQEAVAQAKQAGNPGVSQPIEIDRSQMGKSRGLVLGGEASPSPSASPSAIPSPNASKSPAPSGSPGPSQKN